MPQLVNHTAFVQRTGYNLSKMSQLNKLSPADRDE